MLDGKDPSTLAASALNRFDVPSSSKMPLSSKRGVLAETWAPSVFQAVVLRLKVADGAAYERLGNRYSAIDAIKRENRKIVSRLLLCCAVLCCAVHQLISFL